MDKITASEIGIYQTCPRAWGYYKSGVPQRNKTELIAGVDYHQAIGEQTRSIRKIKQYISWIIIILLLSIGFLIWKEIWG